MSFRQFSSYLKRLEKTSSRNEMTEILAALFKKAESGEIDKICYLLTGRLAPKYRGIEFQMAEKTMLQVLSVAYGAEVAVVKKVFKEVGDLGEAIAHFPKSQISNPKSQINSKHQILNLKQKKLTVADVYGRLLKVAEESGSGSVERKIRGMAELLRQLDGLSAKYAARIPVNKLRLGFSEMTILDSLSWMEKGDKSLRPDLERAFNVSADIGKIAGIFKQGGMKRIKRIRAEPGIPIRAAQAERLPSAAKIMEKLVEAAVEPKFDGLRVQIHIKRDRGYQGEQGYQGYRVEIFSRNLENITAMFPDIVAAAVELKKKVDSAILDGEAIGVDKKNGRFLAFQETVQRKRKHGVLAMVEQIPLKVFLFDCLYYNGRSLLSEPFVERRKVLEKIIPS